MPERCRLIKRKLNYYLTDEDIEQPRNMKLGQGESSDTGLMRINLKKWRNRQHESA